MEKCRCSERPLGIIDSYVELQGGQEKQVLVFGCTNKKCSEYKKGVVKKVINLKDNTAQTFKI